MSRSREYGDSTPKINRRKTDVCSVEDLREVISYDPEAGTLQWKERGGGFFRKSISPLSESQRWNRENAGKEVFTTRGRHGHLQGRVFGKTTFAHRVAWAIAHGEWPQDVIDHINGDPTDNRLENLRHVTQELNARNAKISKNNKSGYNGVVWDRRMGKWRAQIGKGVDYECLGYFDCVDAAGAERKRAEKSRGFHENHGRADNWQSLGSVAARIVARAEK